MKKLFTLIIFGLPCLVMAQENRVTLQEAGTLKQVLQELGLSDAEQLTIAGPINGDDIRTIRLMSGGYDFNKDETPAYTATLIKLDLRDADIIAGGGAYYHDEEYPISSNSPRTWNNTMNKWMFENCSSLEEVICPNSVSMIFAEAFSHCSVKTVIVGEGTKSIHKYAFFECPNLEKVVFKGDENQEMSSGLFERCFQLNEVVCASAYPPSVINEDDVADVSQCDLVVPKGSLERYSAVDFWKNFRSIKESDSILSIASLSNQVLHHQSAVYSVGGGLIRSTADIEGLPRGIYIFGGNKIIVR